jgi:hypothetical protein
MPRHCRRSRLRRQQQPAIDARCTASICTVCYGIRHASLAARRAPLVGAVEPSTWHQQFRPEWASAVAEWQEQACSTALSVQQPSSSGFPAQQWQRRGNSSSSAVNWASPGNACNS